MPAGKSRQRIEKLMTMTDLELKVRGSAATWSADHRDQAAVR